MDLTKEISMSTYNRLYGCMGGGVPLDEIINTLIDHWDEDQVE